MQPVPGNEGLLINEDLQVNEELLVNGALWARSPW
jgi:hypothetical protein